MFYYSRIFLLEGKAQLKLDSADRKFYWLIQLKNLGHDLLQAWLDQGLNITRLSFSLPSPHPNPIFLWTLGWPTDPD